MAVLKPNMEQVHREITARENGPCQCLQSLAAVAPVHPGHCCFLPASQKCHEAEVDAWLARRLGQPGAPS